jgi:hypothetical protein
MTDEPESDTPDSGTDRSRPLVPIGNEWGDWRLNRDALVLELVKDGRLQYELDLESFTSAAKLLDMIVQVHHKTWTSVEDVGQLVAALDQIFNIQPALTPMGEDKGFESREALTAYLVLEELRSNDAGVPEVERGGLEILPPLMHLRTGAASRPRFPTLRDRRRAPRPRNRERRGSVFMSRAHSYSLLAGR